MDEQQELLDFWFGPPGAAAEARRVWFDPDPAFDETLRQRFGALAASAAKGELDPWAEDARGALALVLLLDQLPRNLNRGSAAAFACDARARAVAREAIARGFDQAVPPLQRQFLYLPFEHSERVADQDESMRLFTALPEGSFRDNCVDFARRHHVIIARFGRFPHRNAALARPSSAAEEEFLKEPGSAFSVQAGRGRHDRPPRRKRSR
jgi:uncharacterized protein (DUF924 family)